MTSASTKAEVGVESTRQLEPIQEYVLNFPVEVPAELANGDIANDAKQLAECVAKSESAVLQLPVGSAFTSQLESNLDAQNQRTSDVIYSISNSEQDIAAQCSLNDLSRFCTPANSKFPLATLSSGSLQAALVTPAVGAQNDGSHIMVIQQSPENLVDSKSFLVQNNLQAQCSGSQGDILNPPLNLGFSPISPAASTSRLSVGEAGGHVNAVADGSPYIIVLPSPSKPPAPQMSAQQLAVSCSQPASSYLLTLPQNSQGAGVGATVVDTGSSGVMAGNVVWNPNMGSLLVPLSIVERDEHGNEFTRTMLVPVAPSDPQVAVSAPPASGNLLASQIVSQEIEQPVQPAGQVQVILSGGNGAEALAVNPSGEPSGSAQYILADYGGVGGNEQLMIVCAGDTQGIVPQQHISAFPTGNLVLLQQEDGRQTMGYLVSTGTDGEMTIDGLVKASAVIGDPPTADDEAVYEFRAGDADGDVDAGKIINEVIDAVCVEEQMARCQFICNECGFTAEKRSQLTRHMRKHGSEGEEKKFTCQYCEKSFKTQCTLLNHENTHTGTKPYECQMEDCTASFTTNGELMRHRKYVHTKEKPHKCTRCDYGSVELSKLKRHMRMHTGEKPYTCDFEGCDYASSDMTRLKRHKLCHTGEKPYECDQCLQRFTQSSSLKAHRLTHSGMKPVFACEYCPSTLGRKIDLQIHVRKMHTSDRPLPCTRCDKKFPDRYTLKQHVKSHAGERCYKCSECDYSGTTLASLKTHSICHSAQKPFVCEYPNCEASFKIETLLKKHHNVKHNPDYVPPSPKERRFVCSVCQASFCHHAVLARHEAVHKEHMSTEADPLAGNPAQKEETSNSSQTQPASQSQDNAPNLPLEVQDKHVVPLIPALAPDTPAASEKTVLKVRAVRRRRLSAYPPICRPEDLGCTRVSARGRIRKSAAPMKKVTEETPEPGNNSENSTPAEPPESDAEGEFSATLAADQNTAPSQLAPSLSQETLANSFGFENLDMDTTVTPSSGSPPREESNEDILGLSNPPPSPVNSPLHMPDFPNLPGSILPTKTVRIRLGQTSQPKDSTTDMFDLSPETRKEIMEDQLPLSWKRKNGKRLKD